ncbi:hypothetical protein C5B97_03250 [Pseudoclavibacter sp. RFBB5]|nr:hypothetical protein C5B97_03250 [Pseudoclavibacter sp. RFBB5]
MLVVVTLVRCMLVAIVHVVDVIVVLDRLVAAVLAVRVLLRGVLCDALVLVVVILVQGVLVRAVHVVDVVAVLDGVVAAVLAVRVLVDGMLGVQVCGAHAWCSLGSDCSWGECSSRTCVMASSITCAMWWSANW